MKEKTNKPYKTTIGGQALIEGIMMRGVDQTAMAVRLPDQSIDVEMVEDTAKQRARFLKLPFIRGCINFVDTMRFGYRCLMKSAEKAGLEDEEEPTSEFEKKLEKLFGDRFTGFLMTTASLLAIALAIFLFVYLPSLVVKLLATAVSLGMFRALIEGVIKILIFVGYLALVSRMSDIKRTFGYHGAEHKTIACYEAGETLTVEHIRKHSRFHPRCGTSFILIVLVISILVFSFPIVPWDNLLIRSICKILLLPIIVSISYEIIKFAGRHDNLFTRIISAPGLWLQRLTTREPDNGQIEVAIAAMERVIPTQRGEDQW